MDEPLMTLIPLGVAIAVSPEILVIGLLIASHKERALRNAWAFCIAGVIGIMICVAIGFFIGTTTPLGPSWIRFFIRVMFASLLFLSGIYVLVKRRKNVLMKSMDGARKATTRMSAGLGFVVTGLNFKVISIATTAGHQIAQFSGNFVGRLDELCVFSGFSVLPLILPAIMETIRPGIVSTVMAPCSRFLDKYGRFVTAAICFFFGFVFLKRAIAIMP